MFLNIFWQTQLSNFNLKNIKINNNASDNYKKPRRTEKIRDDV